MSHLTDSNELAGFRSDQGKGQAGCLLFFALVGIAIVIAVNAGPPYYSYRTLEQDIKTEVSRAGARFHSAETLKSNVLELARKNEIILKPEQVTVTRFSSQVKVSVKYEVPVDFYVYQHVMQFNIQASSYVGTL
jgi:hypothetical protein